jgi:hypothetical protein
MLSSEHIAKIAQVVFLKTKYLREITKCASNNVFQPTAFGVRDRAFFEVAQCGAPRRQLKRSTLDGAPSQPCLPDDVVQ